MRWPRMWRPAGFCRIISKLFPSNISEYSGICKWGRLNTWTKTCFLIWWLHMPQGQALATGGARRSGDLGQCCGAGNPPFVQRWGKEKMQAWQGRYRTVLWRWFRSKRTHQIVDWAWWWPGILTKFPPWLVWFFPMYRFQHNVGNRPQSSEILS